MNRPTIEGPDLRLLFWNLDGTTELRNVPPDTAAFDVIHRNRTASRGGRVFRRSPIGTTLPGRDTGNNTIVIFIEVPL